MPQNFIECDREQEMLLPPNMLESGGHNPEVDTIINAVRGSGSSSCLSGACKP